MIFYGISEAEGKTKTENRERINAEAGYGNVGSESNEDVGQ